MIKYVAIAKNGKAGKILHIRIFDTSRQAYDFTYSSHLNKAYKNVVWIVELAHSN